MHKNRNSSVKRVYGFTLVELMTVMAILVIVTMASMVLYTSVHKTQRDGKRYADIGQIAKIIEMYYEDNKSYPIMCGGNQPVSGCIQLNIYVSSIGSMIDPSAITDPCDRLSINACTYAFGTITANNYELFFMLEEPYKATNSKCNVLSPDGIAGC